MFEFFRRRRRVRIQREPFPDGWRTILKRNVSLYERLSLPVRNEIERHVQVLIAEKHFEGCGGLTLNDEIRITIAGHAALLLLGREPHYFPNLVSILVYPSTYVVPVEDRDGAIVTEREDARLGESWRRGVVVLAWDASRSGARAISDGDNVILHEFAHQLDTEDGAADGVPYLDHPSDYAAWAGALEPEYRRLQSEPETSILDDYGATDPAEFFAVATETFFERPNQLRERHPALYAELSKFYNLDLANVGERSPPTGAPQRSRMPSHEEL